MAARPYNFSATLMSQNPPPGRIHIWESMKSDEELMEDYIAGDVKAFETLYARHKGKVYGYIKAKTSEGAEDVFQSAFARLHQKKELYKSEYPFLPWFFTLVRNVVADHGRKLSKQPRTQSLEQEPAAKESAGEIQRSDELEGMNLSEEQFSLLYKKFVEGRGYKELEKELGSTSAALRKKVSRLAQKLRKERR